MASSILKKTTGLTGLAVSKDPHHSLKTLYSKILKTLDKIPDSAEYKTSTKKVILRRLDLVNKETVVLKLEEKINSGQIEEVIKQAENELILSKQILEWKIWDSLIQTASYNQWKWPTA